MEVFQKTQCAHALSVLTATRASVSREAEDAEAEERSLGVQTLGARAARVVCRRALVNVWSKKPRFVMTTRRLGVHYDN